MKTIKRLTIRANIPKPTPQPPPPTPYTMVPPLVYGFDEVITHVLLHMYYYTCRVQSCVY